MIGDYLDLHEHTRRQMIRRAEERAEADAQSCIVRHAPVVGSRQHDAFWRMVEAKRQQASPRVRAFRVR